MSFRRLHNLPFLCLLGLCLLTTPASSLGYVWCLSGDGHVALEAAMADDCGMDDPAPATTAADGLALAVADDDCGPCLDVSTSHQLGSPRSRQNETPASTPVLCVPITFAAHLSPPQRLLTDPLASDPTPRTPEPILYLRTIVLLI